MSLSQPISRLILSPSGSGRQPAAPGLLVDRGRGQPRCAARIRSGPGRGRFAAAHPAAPHDTLAAARRRDRAARRHAGALPNAIATQGRNRTMAGQPVLPKGSPPPLAPYSPGFRSGQFVCTAGMLALDTSGNLIGEGDAGAQTRQVMENIKEILEEAGGSLEDIVYNMIFLADLGDYQAMNEVYATYFPEEPAGAGMHSGRSGQARVPRRDCSHGRGRQLAVRRAEASWRIAPPPRQTGPRAVRPPWAASSRHRSARPGSESRWPSPGPPAQCRG